jgi:hypothetical protein
LLENDTVAVNVISVPQAEPLEPVALVELPCEAAFILLFSKEVRLALRLVRNWINPPTAGAGVRDTVVPWWAPAVTIDATKVCHGLTLTVLLTTATFAADSWLVVVF